VTFTPEMAIAQAQQRFVGAITEIKAALMTVPEVSPLLDHGISPGQPGTVPGVLVCLVLIYGTFETVSGSPGPISPTNPPPVRMWRGYHYQVCTTTTGGAFWSGGGKRDLVLPYNVSSASL
jgi:hypothetical protein